MKKNGFISSALLYGMLALFLVIMISTLAILGNRKLSMDKLKENALNNIQFGYAKMENVYAIYDGFQAPKEGVWEDQSGNNNNGILRNFSNNSYQNRHLIFNGTNNYINTEIPQKELGTQITISTIIDIQRTTGGLWGYYNSDAGNGIYTEISENEEIPGGVLNVCYYTRDNTPLCVEIALEDETMTYKNKKIQLTAVLYSGFGIDVYINGEIHDRIESKLQINPNKGILVIGKSNEKMDDTTNYFKGNMYNFVIYRTVLNDDEIRQNFEEDNERYGIIS